MGHTYSFQKKKPLSSKKNNKYHNIKDSHSRRLKKRTSGFCGAPIQKKLLIGREAHEDLFEPVHK